ncbi:MAG TPA: molybdate ABC transporter substrate-binding protein [Acidimicrobiales bacterium]|nr:molybdate ABC transporter substrate-binding protein [Acidimicrobiales bacterium]
MPITRVSRLAAASLLLATAACGSDDDPGRAGATEPSGGQAVSGPVTVFAAASLTDAFGALASAFEDANPDASVELNFGASSALREQILAGAPADVFASANTANMDQVVEAGAVEGEPEVFARNELQIVVPAGNPGDVRGLDDFADPDLLVGLCAEQAPCGQFGRRVLANANVTPAQDTDEPDVRSLLTKVEAADLDVGLVYATDVRAAGDAVEGIEIPEEDNVVADYPVAALSAATEPDVAAAFVAFVLSAAGQDVLASYGFMPA